MGALHCVDRYMMPATGAANTWVMTLGTAFAVAFAYFGAAWLGLRLLAQPSDVAVFWPASGIAAGILIAAGRRAGVALVFGVLVGTVVANLMSDRSVLTSVLKGFCNAGEVVLMAFLLERWFGQPFAFGNLRRVVGFFAAAALATATSAVGGALVMITFHVPAPFWDAWRTWFFSDAVGIVVVAPFLIEVSQLRREPSSPAKLIEGAGILALTVLASMYAVSLPTGTWLSFDTDAIVFPLLLWLTVRNQRAFAVAGALAVSVVTIGATAFGIGHFGNVNVSTLERVLGAQLVATMVTAFTLVLTGLFAERTKSEEGLRESEERLRLAQLKTGVGIWDWNVRTGKVTWTRELEAIFGLEPGSVAGYADFRDRVHSDDIDAVEAQRDAAVRRHETFSLEFRIIRPDGQVRWISASGGAVYDEATGEPVRVLGNNTDITKRKLAEQALAERNAQFDLARKAARVGTYAYDTSSTTVQLSEASAAIFGLPPSTTEITADNLRSRVHPDDVRRLDAERRRAFKERQAELSSEFSIVRPGGQMRWIEARSMISYAGGRACRVIGVFIDVTERRQAEDHKSLLIAELDHRVKNILACVAAVAEQTRDTTSSMDDFVKVLEGRIKSLAKTHSILSRNRWQGVSITELVRGELAPCMKDSNTQIDGPDVELAAKAAQSLSMVLHELATNAAKHGAWSNRHGRVSVRWRKHFDGEATSKLVLDWREEGGPPVNVTNYVGYGTSVIREIVPYELGGTVDHELLTGGVRCRVEVPGTWLNSTQTSLLH
jgi:PAS domain S-box-containing protein